MNKRIEVPAITVQSRMYIFNPTPYEIEYGSEIESIYVVEGSFDGFLELNPDAPLKTFNPDAIMAKLPEYVEFITEAANSVSNPELVSVLYNAGLCESDEYVTQGELRMLVNRQFGDIFKNDTLLESFDEFKYCTNITKLPDGAFSGCSNLGSITLPESIYKLGNGIFNDCPMLDSIKIDSNNATYADYGCNAIFDIQSKSLIEGCSSSEIPEDCDTIAESAFAGTGIEEAVIPNNIKSIKENAFENCEDLETLSIGSNVEDITTGSFAGCSSLSTISVNEDNPTYDSRDDSNAVIETATDSIVVGCVNTTIPDTVLRIAPKAFKGQSSMVTFTLPEQIESVGSEAFSDCTSLETFTVESDTPSELGADAFENVDSSFKIMVPENTADIYKEAPGWSEYADVIEDPSGPAEPATIEMTVRCTNPSIPTELMYTGMSSYVSKLEIDGVEESTVVESKILTGGLHRIKYTLTDNTTIPENMFRGINAYTFHENDNMLIIADTVTTIGPYAFMSCIFLSHILIPDSVTSIGDYAFYGCYIDYAVFGSGITSLGENIFSRPSAQYVGVETTYVTMKSPVPLTLPQNNPFSDIVDTIYVMPEYLSDYQNSVFATEYGCSISLMKPDIQLKIDPTIGRGSDNMVTIMNEGMSEYVRLMEFNNTRVQPADELEITGSSPVTIKIYLKDDRYIPDGMLAGLTNITACTTASIRLMIIGESAFEGCSNLTKLDSFYKYDDWAYLTIGDKAFRQTGLQGVVTPVTTRKIGASAFAGCTNLTEVKLAGNVKGHDGTCNSIGDFAFNGCTSLTEVYVYQSMPPILDTDVFDNNAVDRIIYVPEGCVEYYQNDWSDYSSVLQEFDFEPV